jgi:hypothetical protein
MKMKYRRMDENGDYIFGLNEQGFLKDNEAVAQAILTKIKLLKGEWWEDVNEGTPLFESILGIGAVQGSKNAIDLIIRDRILSVENVETISYFKSEIDNASHTYMLYCDVETKFGKIENLNINF